MNRRVCMLLAMASLVAGAAWAQPVSRGVPIRSSRPRNDTSSTNLNQFADPNRNRLRRLEEDFSRPLEIFSPAEADALARPLPHPPAGPIIQSRRIRELLDKKQNWPFVPPEDQVSGLTDEEIMGVRQFDEQGRRKETVSAFEKFFMSRGQTGATNRLSDDAMRRSSDDAWLSQPEGGDKPSNPFEARVQEVARNLQGLLKEDATARLSLEIQPSFSLADPFNSPPHEKTREEKAQDLRLDQFRQMMQVDSLKPAGLPGLPGPGGLAGPSVLGGSAFKPVLVPPVGGLSGASLAARPVVPEVRPPVVAPPNPPLSSVPTTLGELPRRKF